MRIEKTRVLVTGGAGFIGSHLVDTLLARGNEVLVVDDLSSGELINLAHHEADSRLRVEVADILDFPAMRELCRGVDFVFHLACRGVRLSINQPTIVHEVNATGSLNMLKAAAAGGAKRFLYCSSSEVNGTADVVPMPEDYHFKPETIYGASKLTGEYYTQVFQRAGWMDTVIIRPHNNYGPREHYRGVLGEVVPRFILLALAGEAPVIYGDGLQTRDFTYVEETAAYLVRALECDAAVGTTMNLCRGQEVSVLEIARIVAEAVGLDRPPVHETGRPCDVLRLFGDPSRLRATLGDSPSVSIREGLERTIAWFRDNVPLDETLLDDLRRRNWEAASPEEWLATATRRRPAGTDGGPAVG